MFDTSRSFLGIQIISNTINAVANHLQSVRYSDFDLFCIGFDWSPIESLIVIKRVDLICTISDRALPHSHYNQYSQRYEVTQ